MELIKLNEYKKSSFDEDGRSVMDVDMDVSIVDKAYTIICKITEQGIFTPGHPGNWITPPEPSEMVDSYFHMEEIDVWDIDAEPVLFEFMPVTEEQIIELITKTDISKWI